MKSGDLLPLKAHPIEAVKFEFWNIIGSASRGDGEALNACQLGSSSERS